MTIKIEFAFDVWHLMGLHFSRIYHALNESRLHILEFVWNNNPKRFRISFRQSIAATSSVSPAYQSSSSPTSLLLLEVM